MLTRGPNKEFVFGREEEESMEEFKKLITTTPVLMVVDYEKAQGFSRTDENVEGNLDGLVVVVVDLYKTGTGWILLQYQGKEKRPVLFGSCTFNDVKSRYLQPKCKLCGLFWAVKALRHQIWGVHFRLDVDAKFLMEMIRNPDLLNTPMT